MEIKKYFKKFTLIIITLLILLGAYFIFFPNNKNSTDYVTTKVNKGNIEKTILASGKLQPFKKVDVGAQVSGQISKLFVNIGDHVKKGDLIAEIDPRTQKNELQIAQTKLANNKAIWISKEAELNLTKQELKRQETMFAGGATSKEKFQNAKANYKMAQAALNQAKEQIKQSQINVDTAKLNLGYTTVTAPQDGVVISTAVEEGQTVNANQNTPTIVTLAQLNKMKIKAEISEADVAYVKSGMPVRFTLLGDNSKSYKTTLLSVDPAPSFVSDNVTNSNAAIYYYGKMEIPNEDNMFKIDMTANISIIATSAKNVLLVPNTAISEKNNTHFIYILNKKGKLENREIQVGISDGINTEVKTGLKEGETIIVSQVDPDQKETIQNTTMKKASSRKGPR